MRLSRVQIRLNFIPPPQIKLYSPFFNKNVRNGVKNGVKFLSKIVLKWC